MKLYLVQHAEALSKEESPHRTLSQKGLADAIKMANFLFKADVRVDEVAHSGKSRAKETACVLSKTVWLDQAPKEMEGLGPNDSTDHLWNATQVAGGDLMVVGHLPFMARMVSRCLSGTQDGVSVLFEPGSIVCLERSEDGNWSLNWMQRPSLLTED